MNQSALRPYQKLEMLAAVTGNKHVAEVTLYRTTEGILLERVVFDIIMTDPWAVSYREHFATDEEAIEFLQTCYPYVDPDIHIALLDAWQAKPRQ